jgi:hypothetical protein
MNMNVDYLHFNELLDLLRAMPATNHDASVVRYHLAALASMPLPLSTLEAVDDVPELVELVMHADDRTYGVFLGFTVSGNTLRAYSYWRDPAVDGHRREQALPIARRRYWKDHVDD